MQKELHMPLARRLVVAAAVFGLVAATPLATFAQDDTTAPADQASGEVAVDGAAEGTVDGATEEVAADAAPVEAEIVAAPVEEVAPAPDASMDSTQLVETMTEAMPAPDVLTPEELVSQMMPAESAPVAPVEQAETTAEPVEQAETTAQPATDDAATSDASGDTTDDVSGEAPVESTDTDGDPQTISADAETNESTDDAASDDAAAEEPAPEAANGEIPVTSTGTGSAFDDLQAQMGIAEEPAVPVAPVVADEPAAPSEDATTPETAATDTPETTGSVDASGDAGDDGGDRDRPRANRDEDGNDDAANSGNNGESTSENDGNVEGGVIESAQRSNNSNGNNGNGNSNNNSSNNNGGGNDNDDRSKNNNGNGGNNNGNGGNNNNGNGSRNRGGGLGAIRSESLLGRLGSRAALAGGLGRTTVEGRGLGDRSLGTAERAVTNVGNGGSANSSANGGIIMMGPVISGNNKGNTILVGSEAGNGNGGGGGGGGCLSGPIYIDGGDVDNSTTITLSADGGTSISDASGGNGNTVEGITPGGIMSVGNGGDARSNANGGIIMMGPVISGGNEGNTIEVQGGPCEPAPAPAPEPEKPAKPAKTTPSKPSDEKRYVQVLKAPANRGGSGKAVRVRAVPSTGAVDAGSLGNLFALIPLAGSIVAGGLGWRRNRG